MQNKSIHIFSESSIFIYKFLINREKCIIQIKLIILIYSINN